MSSREFCSWQLKSVVRGCQFKGSRGWPKGQQESQWLQFFGDLSQTWLFRIKNLIIIYQVMWYMTPCWLACFTEYHKSILPPCLGKNSTKIPLSLDCFTLKMEALCSSETLVIISRFSVTSHRTWIFTSTHVQVSYFARRECSDLVLSLYNKASSNNVVK